MDTNREMQYFYRNLFWLRKQHRLSKRQMAQRLDISVYTLNKLEAGILPPRLPCRIFLTVYRNFGILPSDLVGGFLGDFR